MESQIQVQAVINKLSEQIANQAMRIATLEAYIDQMAVDASDKGVDVSPEPPFPSPEKVSDAEVV